MDCYKKKGQKKEEKKNNNKSYFLQTHILKQTLLLQASRAGGWQAEWKNGRTERGASILITVKKKSHTLRHTHYTLQSFGGFFGAFFIFFSNTTPWS